MIKTGEQSWWYIPLKSLHSNIFVKLKKKTKQKKPPTALRSEFKISLFYIVLFLNEGGGRKEGKKGRTSQKH